VVFNCFKQIVLDYNQLHGELRMINKQSSSLTSLLLIVKFIFNKWRSLSCVLRCDKTRRVSESMRECRKHEPQSSVFYISQVLSNIRSVLSQCNTWLRLLHLLCDIQVMRRKTIKHSFSIFYTLINHGFWPIKVRAGCSHGASILFCLHVFCPLFSIFQLLHVYLLFWLVSSVIFGYVTFHIFVYLLSSLFVCLGITSSGVSFLVAIVIMFYM